MNIDLNNIKNLITSNIDTLALFVNVVIALLTYRNLREFKNNNFEENRGQIIFYIEKTHPTLGYNLVIKNFGKSIAKVIDFKVTPDIRYKNGQRSISDDYKNITLAPNQSLVCNSMLTEHKNDYFEVYIKYETCSKIFDIEYNVNLSILKNLTFIVPDIKNEYQGYDQINRTLLGISNKLSS